MINIVLNLSISSRFSSRVVSGALQYLREFNELQVFLPQTNLAQQYFPDRVDGVIGVFNNLSRRRIDPLIKSGVPAVNVSTSPYPGSTQVCANSPEICRMALSHLEECHMRNLTFIDFEGNAAVENKREAFFDVCRDAGLTYNLLNMNPYLKAPSEEFERALRHLPKPACVFLPTHNFAEKFVRVCDKLGIRIPDDIQVVSVNNGPEPLGENNVTITSVDPGNERIGFEAAKALIERINGKVLPEIIELEPRELIRRSSTSTLPLYSPAVNGAVNFMHNHLSKEIEMDDLTSVEGVGRRAMEKRFANEVGVPPMRYLQHIRLEHACFLLSTTEYTLTEIGGECGIPNPVYLCRLFHKRFGMTPGQYRKHARGKGN